MMDEYPDPEDEYDLVHQDELELMLEIDSDIEPPIEAQAKKSRQSLNFDENSEKSSEKFPAKRNSTELDLDGVDLLEPPPPKRSRVEVPKLSVDISRKKPNTNKNGITSISFPIWNFVTINTDFGERFYVKIKDRSKEHDDAVNVASKLSNASESFKTLKERVVNSLSIDQNENDATRHICGKEADNAMQQSELWVEKFKPKKYMELLSDEGVNRTLLNWIKMWDKVVFNRERTTKKSIKSEIQPTVFKSKFQAKEEEMAKIDEDGRPSYKIALLCGPPGIGKTTLAHVIANVAGYNAIEVNASDDRTIDIFKTKLESSTQMQSVMGERKPNCLILDEIDGAPTPSIEYLLKYVNGKATEKSKKAKKEKVKIVKRPVICICNEAYSANLRQLRQQAFVVHFTHTSSSKLAQRLLEICRKQDLKTDMSTLTLLCDKANCDIRSCITTLNFLKTKNEKTLRASDIVKTNLGLKDVQKSLFNIWQEIFQKPVNKNDAFGESSNSGYEAENDYNPRHMKRLHRIVQLIQSAGDNEKLQQGVYENAFKMCFPRFHQAAVSSLEWFCWTDLIDTSIRHEQNFVLLPYLPYAFAAWHFLFSTPSWPKVTYPNCSYENHLKTTKCEQILKDIVNGLSPTLRAHTQPRSLLLDILPLLQPILTPVLRPVNLTLYNEKEKAEFAHVTDIMLDFNMNYTQQRAADGTYFYTFDPCVDDLIRFPLANRDKIYEFSYNMKQLISREVELERVRRLDALFGGAQQTIENPKDAKKVVAAVSKKAVEKAIPVDSVESVQYRDFFGRVVQVERRNMQRSGFDKTNYVKSPIWFNFKEGFNNAVKKDLTIADLL